MNASIQQHPLALSNFHYSLLRIRYDGPGRVAYIVSFNFLRKCIMSRTDCHHPCIIILFIIKKK